jgi:hypothetical protein
MSVDAYKVRKRPAKNVLADLKYSEASIGRP